MKGNLLISTFPVILLGLLTCAEHTEYVDVRRSTNQLHDFTNLLHSPIHRGLQRIIFHADIWRSKFKSYIWMLTVFGPAAAQLACHCERLMFICLGSAGQVIYLHSWGVLTRLLTLEKNSSVLDPGGLCLLTDLC